MARPKKIKETAPKKEEKEFVEAVVPPTKQLSRHRSVNSILGFKLARYKTDDEKVYLKQIRAMNKIDLQRECARVELYPKDNRELMIERLIKQFRQHTAANQPPPRPVQIKITKRSRDILARSETPLS